MDLQVEGDDAKEMLRGIKILRLLRY